MIKKLIIGCVLALVATGCGFYSFTGTNINPDVQTFQVNYFQNTAALIEPGIERDFTIALQELIQNQTSLDLVTANGDLVYEGEITRYYIAPITATANNTAAQNRLTIEINVRFINKKDETDDFEQRFNFYYDYPASQQLVGGNLDVAIEFLYERITQDVFNASLAKW